MIKTDKSLKYYQVNDCSAQLDMSSTNMSVFPHFCLFKIG